MKAPTRDFQNPRGWGVEIAPEESKRCQMTIRIKEKMMSRRRAAHVHMYALRQEVTDKP